MSGVCQCHASDPLPLLQSLPFRATPRGSQKLCAVTCTDIVLTSGHTSMTVTSNGFTVFSWLHTTTEVSLGGVLGLLLFMVLMCDLR